MLKKLISFVLVSSLLIGNFTLAASAKSSVFTQINLKTARDIATFYLATLEPISIFANSESGSDKARLALSAGEKDTVKLGSNFKLLDTKTFYNAKDEAAFYNFNYESTAQENLKGYITVSVNSDLPYVMDNKLSPSPFDDTNIAKTYYISPLLYFNKMADGTYVNQSGEKADIGQVENSFNDYNQYRADLFTQNPAFIQGVAAENIQTLTAINDIKTADFWSNLSFEKINDYLLVILNYFIDSVWHTGNIAQINAAVEEIIKNHAGAGYSVSFASVVDKNFMVPQYQSYYETNVGDGICGKASSMMALAFYRDGRGFSNLPDDHTMYAELSAIYDDMTQYFSFFFDNTYVKDEIGLSESYEMMGTLDMGLAYYLYSKGYVDAAKNVIDNACFSITMVPDALSNTLMTILKVAMSKWLHDKTYGKLTFITAVKSKTDDIIINTLKKGEPVVIGSLAAIGCNWYSNHYFAGVGYYKMESDVKIGSKTVYKLYKEYVEVYDTWAHDSSVMNWTVFKSTALYSSTSLADV